MGLGPTFSHWPVPTPYFPRLLDSLSYLLPLPFLLFCPAYPPCHLLPLRFMLPPSLPLPRLYFVLSRASISLLPSPYRPSCNMMLHSLFTPEPPLPGAPLTSLFVVFCIFSGFLASGCHPFRPPDAGPRNQAPCRPPLPLSQRWCSRVPQLLGCLARGRGLCSLPLLLRHICQPSVPHWHGLTTFHALSLSLSLPLSLAQPHLVPFSPEVNHLQQL